ncbi:protein SET DOMAIN GROUP 40 isoform X1 [Phalaenopsis equestris]|uniref:protein SET DOMAIN GROUP 40 isoform X1 n=1 Tax=Phalaenopsis equestris TaxID=78828 RepID=UPI0009E5AB82|nr:protein SET DOMAIN GROUP 40 isoform X1 [Phalaenopsis equestris]
MSSIEGPKMEALLCWAAQIGISDDPSQSPSTSIPSPSCLGHSLVVSNFSNAGGRGFAACRDLRMGELILRVPRTALLTKQSVLRDEWLASCMKKRPHLSSSQKLTICLLAEVAKGRDSRWYPYLVLLPSSYNTLPNFHEFEIHALQVEDAIWVSEKAVVRARSDWKESLVVMQEMKLKLKFLSFRSWLWASATISSRTLYIPWDDAGCLCPVGDLFNYAAPDDKLCIGDSYFEGNEVKELAQLVDSSTRRLTDGGYEENSASYCFYAMRNYKIGEQVLLSYGTYSNLDLLEHYGFLLSSNPNDKAFLHLDIDSNISDAWSKDLLYIQPDGKPSFALLCSLRLDSTPRNLRRALGHRAFAGFFLSNENEALAMTKLVNHCCVVLDELPTKIEDDASLLSIINEVVDFGACFDRLESAFSHEEFAGFIEANGLQRESLLTAKALRSLERWRLAVHWRLFYKTILSNCLSYCRKVMSEIS